MLIERSLLSHIRKTLQNEPIIIFLYGPRQAGKTTIVQQLLTNYEGKYVFFNGDDLRTQELFSSSNLDRLKKAVGQAPLIVIDEAQRITNIGIILKLIYDTLHIRIIATGSSSFELANKINEPLTGRSTTFLLYPLSILEIPFTAPDASIIGRIEEFLRFGLYPKTVTLTGEEDKKQYLTDLVNTYLYKDILAFETVRKPKKVIDLLSLLALQIGNEVAIAELAQNLALSKIIVDKYLDILEKMFIIVNIRGFSRNMRKEISKTSKYYFIDLGLRNALIRNFNPLHLRSDTGAMFENFCVVEKLKALANRRQLANLHFWRTYDQKEIDIIEEREGKLFAYECKWSENKGRTPLSARTFTLAYPNSTFTIVTPANLEAFLNQNAV